MNSKGKMTARRIAANIIETPEGIIEQGIVVIENGVVTKSYAFTDEEPMTEWTTGTVTIRLDCHGLPRAYKDNRLIT